MTNKEKYKQAFSAVHVSDDFILEAKNMHNTTRQHRLKPIAAIIAACILLMGTVTTAYAADLGGIQRMIQIWIHGDQTSATITFDGSGAYDMDYTTPDGNTQHRGGGGVAFEAGGAERPLTEQELMELLTSPEVEYKEDGTVWVYWYDQALEITDRFADGVCFVKLENGDEALYMTVKYRNGWASSPKKYIMPEEFN